MHPTVLTTRRDRLPYPLPKWPGSDISHHRPGNPWLAVMRALTLAMASAVAGDVVVLLWAR
jgi:hypothetical protein